MALATGIKWTDSTDNDWWGCTKVENAIACISCYAEATDERAGGGHWGHGAPRRRMSEHTRNEAYRWNKNADKFFAEHGRRQRVFTLSMGDLFDKEVPDEWRLQHMAKMEACSRLEWQICTKRIPNLPKMVPDHWKTMIGAKPQQRVGENDDLFVCRDHLEPYRPGWPRNIGVLITAVTQKEADRDVPRLLKMKKDFGIPWVGISYEPAAEEVDWYPYLTTAALMNYGTKLDWIIFGGKSGAEWKTQDFDVAWAYKTSYQCFQTDTPFFMKQMAGFRPTDDMIPPELMIRQWPKGH